MAIIKCSQCNQAISTKNSNCSGCGMKINSKPQKRQLSRIELGLIVVGVLILGSGLTLSMKWGVQAWNVNAQEHKICSTSDGVKVYELFNQISLEWDDALKLAGSTSRMNLPPRIAELQSIRRNIQAQVWPECAKPAQEHLISGMDSMIDGFILFLDSDNSEALSEAKLAIGESEFTLFSLELAKLKPSEKN